MTTDEIISRCYEHGQPDYVLAADRLKALQDALQQQEDADAAHVNCDECDGEEIPELCPKCFPRYDDARTRRRAVLYEGKPVDQIKDWIANPSSRPTPEQTK
jgi:hypothetical protein